VVQWGELIPAIIGGGLFVYLIQFAVSQLVLIPNIEIYYNQTVSGFILSNIGLSSATKAVITLDWRESIATSPTLLSTNYVQNGSIRFSTVDNEIWQVQVPRISPGAASSYLIEVPSKPVTVYITYDQGSEIWPPSKLRNNTTYFWIFIIAGFSTASFAAALLYRYHKRKYIGFTFLVRVAHDINQVMTELQQSPFFTMNFYTTNGKDHLYTTRHWDVKNKMFRQRNSHPRCCN
jgi:hypothetical protein